MVFILQFVNVMYHTVTYLLEQLKEIETKTTEYTLFSSAHGIFSRIDRMLGQKTSLNKFKRIGIISSIFSKYYGMKLFRNQLEEEKWENQKPLETKRHATKQPVGQ